MLLAAPIRSPRRCGLEPVNKAPRNRLCYLTSIVHGHPQDEHSLAQLRYFRKRLRMDCSTVCGIEVGNGRKAIRRNESASVSFAGLARRSVKGFVCCDRCAVHQP